MHFLSHVLLSLSSPASLLCHIFPLNFCVQVQANPRIPEPNKLSAEQRYHTLLATCHDTITRWAAATCSSPAFQQLQPAMLAISAPMRTSLASGSWQCPASSASSGKLMEQAALAVLQASLPSDWSLLPSLHLQGEAAQSQGVWMLSMHCFWQVQACHPLLAGSECRTHLTLSWTPSTGASAVNRTCLPMTPLVFALSVSTR